MRSYVLGALGGLTAIALFLIVMQVRGQPVVGDPRRAELLRQIDAYERLYQETCPNTCGSFVASTLWKQERQRFFSAHPEVDRYVTWYLATRNDERSRQGYVNPIFESQFTFDELRQDAYIERFLAGGR